VWSFAVLFLSCVCVCDMFLLDPSRQGGACGDEGQYQAGVYTVLSLPILYGVWRATGGGGSGWVVYCAIAV